jgi:Cd2+/Zn2+-exporting ATPase
MLEASDLQSVTGRGLVGVVDDVPVEVGSLRLWQDEVIPDNVLAAVERLTASAKTVAIVKQGERWLGVLGVADELRTTARPTLDALRKLGIRPIVMLTGDNRGVGEAVGKLAGVDEVRAGLLPEDKVDEIRAMADKYKRVGMIGDGINDAPALANATVGIAMGGAGTAVALETADVALMGDDLAKLPFVVGLARQASGIIRQNLFIALFVIAGLVLSTTTGMLDIGPAVVFHEGSTLVVLANSLRLLAYRKDFA